MTFMVRNRHYALPSHSVKQIIENHDGVKKVFCGSSTIKGIIDFEGDLVSILDTPAVLEIVEEGRDPIILICKEKGMEGAAGLMVSAIKGMEIVDSSAIKPAHGSEATYIHGFIRERADKSEKVVALIDLKRFLDYAFAMGQKAKNTA